MRELILAMRAIWDALVRRAASLEFRGEFYTHTLMTPMFTPTDTSLRRRRSVFLAAVGPQMTEVAGEVADGVIVHALHHREVPARSHRCLALERGLAKAGQAHDPPTGLEFTGS